MVPVTRQAAINYCVVRLGDDERVLEMEEKPQTKAALERLCMPEEWLTAHNCDPVWMAWGQATGITYLDDVILEHLHYSVGKSPVDESYIRSNALTTADLIAYNAYCENPGPGGLNDDIRKFQGIEWSPERIRKFNDDLLIPPLRG